MDQYVGRPDTKLTIPETEYRENDTSSSRYSVKHYCFNVSDVISGCRDTSAAKSKELDKVGPLPATLYQALSTARATGAGQVFGNIKPCNVHLGGGVHFLHVVHLSVEIDL